MENKPFKSIDEMCCLLIQDRGLICPDDNELRKFLSRTNYYRFSGYARDFQEVSSKSQLEQSLPTNLVMSTVQMLTILIAKPMRITILQKNL